MRVELTTEWEGHAADEVVEVDDITGGNLVWGGLARPASEATPDESWTLTRLRDYVTAHSIDLGSAKSKADILSAISAPSIQPADADEPKEAS